MILLKTFSVVGAVSVISLNAALADDLSAIANDDLFAGDLLALSEKPMSEVQLMGARGGFQVGGLVFNIGVTVTPPTIAPPFPNGGPLPEGGPLGDGGVFGDSGGPLPEGGPLGEGGVFGDNGGPLPEGGPLPNGPFGSDETPSEAPPSQPAAVDTATTPAPPQPTSGAAPASPPPPPETTAAPETTVPATITPPATTTPTQSVGVTSGPITPPAPETTTTPGATTTPAPTAPPSAAAPNPAPVTTSVPTPAPNPAPAASPSPAPIAPAPANAPGETGGLSTSFTSDAGLGSVLTTPVMISHGTSPTGAAMADATLNPGGTQAAPAPVQTDAGSGNTELNENPGVEVQMTNVDASEVFQTIGPQGITTIINNSQDNVVLQSIVDLNISVQNYGFVMNMRRSANLTSQSISQHVFLGGLN